MAGLGRKTWSALEVVTAANVQGYLQDQVVQVFAGTAAAGSALGTAVSEGMVRYVSDNDEMHMYTSDGWTNATPKDVAGKNKIINGGHDFWQRGTSVSITSVSNTYTADRWVTTLNQRTSGTLVVRQNTADKQTTDNYCLEIDATGLVTTAVLFHTQILETRDVVPLRGKTLTLSFWAKVASGSGTFLSAVRDGTDIDGFPSTSSTQTEGSHSVTTSWQKFTISHTVQAGANSICVRFTTPTAFAGKVFFSQVQLEVGSVATPFSRAAGTIQGELAACQRYYQRITAETAYGHFASGIASSSTLLTVLVPLKVTMRVAPTSLDYGGTIGVNDTTILNNISSAALGGDGNSNIARVQVVSTGMTTYRMTNLLGNNSATAYIGFSSEL
jgi:hypothetical protein